MDELILICYFGLHALVGLFFDLITAAVAKREVTDSEWSLGGVVPLASGISAFVAAAIVLWPSSGPLVRLLVLLVLDVLIMAALTKLTARTNAKHALIIAICCAFIVYTLLMAVVAVTAAFRAIF